MFTKEEYTKIREELKEWESITFTKEEYNEYNYIKIKRKIIVFKTHFWVIINQENYYLITSNFVYTSIFIPLDKF